jgi:DNA polymerase III, alpha subunit
MSDKNLSNQSDMFGSDLSTHFKFLDNEKWSKSYSLMKEFEMLGFYLTGHPLNQYEEKYDDLNLKYFENIKSNKNLHNSKGMLVAGTLLSKKEKRSARGNAYAFLNFSDTSSIYELIIFETNLRKYRELLIEGESYVLGVDFTSDNNSLRGELKKVFSFDQVLKFNKKNDNKFKKDIERQGSTLKIYVNNDFAKDKLSELKLISGYHKVEIIINNQIVKVPGDFEVNKELIASIKT